MFKKLFSSPIGESIFSTNKLGSTGGKQTILVPYRGIYFLYDEHGNSFRSKRNILVPYRGIYFLYMLNKVYSILKVTFSSPIGESIFSTHMLTLTL